MTYVFILSVCLSVMSAYCTKMADLIEIPFEVVGLAGSKDQNNVLDDPPWVYVCM